jgi:uncharacterized protein
VLTGDLDIALNMAIRQEYDEVLRRPEFHFPAPRVDTLLSIVDWFGLFVAAVPPWPVTLPDPDDEPFLGVAAATDSVLVTGNLRHFPVRSRRGVAVLIPRELVERLRRRR